MAAHVRVAQLPWAMIDSRQGMKRGPELSQRGQPEAHLSCAAGPDRITTDKNRPPCLSMATAPPAPRALLRRDPGPWTMRVSHRQLGDVHVVGDVQDSAHKRR